MTRTIRIIVLAAAMLAASIAAGWHWAGIAQAGGCTRGNYCLVRTCAWFSDPAIWGLSRDGYVFYNNRWYTTISTSWGDYKTYWKPYRDGRLVYRYLAYDNPPLGLTTGTCVDVIDVDGDGLTGAIPGGYADPDPLVAG